MLPKFTLTSYIAYLLPFAASLYWSVWLSTIAIGIAVCFGFLYHYYNERRFHRTDFAAASALIAANAYLCYLGAFTEPYFTAAIVFLLLALVHYLYLQNRGNYEFHHGMWHVDGALITLCCILVYAL